MTTSKTTAHPVHLPAGALRAAIAAADPATLTREDMLALLDLAERAFDAAGIG